MNIFRYQKKLPETGLRMEKLSTRRVPSNVPYVVDNLWEWTRPEGYPSRRSAVCGSPTPEAAKKYAQNTEQLYLIVPPETARLVQLKDLEDAKYHVDCRKLKKILTSSLSKKGWIEMSLDKKRNIAPLWVPGVTKDEVESLFFMEPLKDIKDEVWEAVSFWKDLQHLDYKEEQGNDIGEIFFEADEWFLRPVEEE